MSTKKTLEQFIKDARAVHGGKYDYAKAVYTGCENKVIITCRKHGDFLQSANNHVSGSGCSVCFAERKSISMTQHGASKEPLYAIWRGMLARCEFKRHKSYEQYGGRGIGVCKEWHSYEIFKGWAEKYGYMLGLQLDRIDNDVGYSARNCRWATPEQNCRNRRNTIRVSVSGVSTTLDDFADVFGLKQDTVYSRWRRAGCPTNMRVHEWANIVRPVCQG